MIFPSDIIGKLFIGKSLKGYIKNIREEDGELIYLFKSVLRRWMTWAFKILLWICLKKGGFLPLNDKSSPEAILAFRTSKVVRSKRPSVVCYKSGKISIDKEGIRLAE